MSLDELWATPAFGNPSWYARTTPAIRQVCDEIADKIIERGGEPNWAAVRRYMDDLFPGEIPTAKNTVMDNVRRLVKERQ